MDEAPEVKKEDVPPPAAPPQPVMDEAELSLQRLVEKYQEKTEKEIQRTLKVCLSRWKELSVIVII